MWMGQCAGFHGVKSKYVDHKSRLLFGKLKGVSLMLMQGRFHHYEGYTLGKVSEQKIFLPLSYFSNVVHLMSVSGLTEQKEER